MVALKMQESFEAGPGLAGEGVGAAGDVSTLGDDCAEMPEAITQNT